MSATTLESIHTILNVAQEILPLHQQHARLTLTTLHQCHSSTPPPGPFIAAVEALHNDTWQLAQKCTTQISDPELSAMVLPVSIGATPPAPRLVAWADVVRHLQTIKEIIGLIGATATPIDLSALQTRLERTGDASPAPIRETPVEPIDDRDIRVENGPSKRPEQLNNLMAEPVTVQLGISLISTEFIENLTARIKLIRQQMLEQLGVLIPPIHLVDNLRIPPNSYQIRLHDIPVASHTIYPNKQMIISPDGPIDEQFVGDRIAEPSFGLPACWIEPQQVDAANARNYTVVDALTVLITNFSEICLQHIDEIFGYQQLDEIIGLLHHKRPLMMQSLRDTGMSHATLLTVLRGLLRERVSIRNTAAIIECCIASPEAHPHALVSLARERLARQICHQYTTSDGTLHAMTLSRALEQRIAPTSPSWSDLTLNLSPAQATEFINQLIKHWDHDSGSPVLLVSSEWLRAALFARFRHTLPEWVVLSRREMLPTTQLTLTKPPVAIGQP